MFKARQGVGDPDFDRPEMLVVVPATDVPFFQRSAAAYRALRGVSVGMRVNTEEEFRSRDVLPVSL